MSEPVQSAQRAALVIEVDVKVHPPGWCPRSLTSHLCDITHATSHLYSNLTQTFSMLLRFGCVHSILHTIASPTSVRRNIAQGMGSMRIPLMAKIYDPTTHHFGSVAKDLHLKHVVVEVECAAFPTGMGVRRVLAAQYRPCSCRLRRSQTCR